MSEIKQNDIIDNLRGIDGNGTLLDILLEFEHMLDEQGMYGYEDLDTNKKPKLKDHAVWLVDIWMPRKFVDEALSGRDVTDGSINQSELSNAYEAGLDDETNIGQDK